MNVPGVVKGKGRKKIMFKDFDAGTLE
jgi:hypothetical protein